MSLMDQAQNVSSNFSAVFNSVRESISFKNIKSLPGKFVTAVVTVFSTVVNLVAKPFVWAWSKVPAAPQPSLLSRLSSFLFKTSAVVPALVLQEDLQKVQTMNDELQKIQTMYDDLGDKFIALQLEVSSVVTSVGSLSNENAYLIEKIEELTRQSSEHKALAEAFKKERDEALVLRDEALALKEVVTPSEDDSKVSANNKSVFGRASLMVSNVPSLRKKKNTVG